MQDGKSDTDTSNTKNETKGLETDNNLNRDMDIPFNMEPSITTTTETIVEGETITYFDFQ